MSAPPGDEAKMSSGSIQMPKAWIGADEQVAVWANEFIARFTPDGSFVITCGQIKPPVLLGSEEEMRRQAESLPFVPVSPVSTVALSVASMREFVAILNQNLAQYDAMNSEGSE